MKRHQPSKKKPHASLRRDRALLALATAGDVALDTLLKIISAPIMLAQLPAEVARYGSAADLSKIRASVDFGESGVFRDIAELSIYIARLRRQGLVIKKKEGYMTITEKGLSMLKDSFSIPSYARRYKISKATPRIITMVIFDIPETENEKRDWLRFQLKSLEFRKVQGSVWLGQHPLPEDFLYDLKRYRMLSYVHVFSINRSGTISDLITKFGFQGA